jgi:hypothetical protein
MAWLKKRPDPITDRARALNDEIAALEAEIQRLDTQLQRNQGHPRLRSTALPHGSTLNYLPADPAAAGAPNTAGLSEPIFEDVDQDRLKERAESTTTPEHYNELGVRKYDLPALVGRFRTHLRGPAATNPKLVSYLAAGGIHGLRPMRYEKRVARNRFIFFAVILFLALLGTLLVFLQRQR